MKRTPSTAPMAATAAATLPLLLLSPHLPAVQCDEQQQQSWVDKTKESTKEEIAAMFGEGKNSPTFIVVCVAMGILLLIFILAIALCCRRRKKRQIAKMKKKRNESILPTTTTPSSTTTTTTKKKVAVANTAAPPPSSTKLPNNTPVVRNGGTKHSAVVLPPSRKPQSQPQPPPPVQSYFGTIQSSENDMDDVSTLGDPFMVMGVNARMDADNTVGER